MPGVPEQTHLKTGSMLALASIISYSLHQAVLFRCQGLTGISLAAVAGSL